MKGINARVVGQISLSKPNPSGWSSSGFARCDCSTKQPMTEWFAVNMPDIDFQDIDDVLQRGDARRDLAGNTALLGSEAVGQEHRADLEEQGVLFCDMDTAVREYPRLVQEYFGTIIPPGDDKFADLNTSAWSGGSFVYVPPGVEVAMPLQSDIRPNSETGGQFQRTLIIADEGSKVRYIEGCAAPVYTQDALRCAVVEIVVKPNAWVSYTTMQNWSHNVDNLVTNRARVEADGHMEFVDVRHWLEAHREVSRHLLGRRRRKWRSALGCLRRQGPASGHGAKMVHAAPNTTSKMVSKSISQDGGTTTCRGLVSVDEGATGATSVVSCEALLLDEQSASLNLPHLEIVADDAQINHETNVSKNCRRTAFLPDVAWPL